MKGEANKKEWKEGRPRESTNIPRTKMKAFQRESHREIKSLLTATQSKSEFETKFDPRSWQHEGPACYVWFPSEETGTTGSTMSQLYHLRHNEPTAESPVGTPHAIF